MNYEILTDNSILYNGPIETEEDEKFVEEGRENIITEQNAILKASGYEMDGIVYKIHFFDSPFHNEGYRMETIYDAIQMLAIKDGVDLVEYENGNIGFVSYYNDKRDAFEIMNPTTEEIIRYDDGLYNWANETYKRRNYHGKDNLEQLQN